MNRRAVECRRGLGETMRGTKRILAGVAALALLAVVAAACGTPTRAPKTQAQLAPADKARMAQSMLNAGRTQEAVRLLDEAIAEEPDNAGMQRFYGAMLFRLGRYPAAEAALKRSLEIDPYLTDARRVLGAVYNEEGRPADAEREWKKVLEDPAYTEPEKVYLNLGVLYGQQGRDGDAIGMLRQAVRIDPRYYQAHYELASLLDSTGRLDEAVSEYEVAEPGYKDSGEYHYRLGFAYFRLDEKAKAREALNRAIAVAPGSPSAAQADDLLKVLD